MKRALRWRTFLAGRAEDASCCCAVFMNGGLVFSSSYFNSAHVLDDSALFSDNVFTRVPPRPPLKETDLTFTVTSGQSFLPRPHVKLRSVSSHITTFGSTDF